MSFSSVLLVLMLISCLLPVVDQAATFVVNVTQSSYEAEENHSITLEWTFTTRTQGSYRELSIYCSLLAPHREQVLYQVHEGVEFPDSQDDQFSGRVQIDKDILREGRIRLHVSRLRTEDSGRYRCGVKTEDGFGSAECRLSISDINQQTGCPRLIYGTVGQNVTLQCKLEEKLENVFLSWTLKNESSGLLKQAHMYRNKGNDEDSQHPDYRKRTSVFPEQFKHGNISLELTNITKKDEGTYIWTVHNDNVFFNSGNITLRVGDENRGQNNWTAGENNRAVKNIVVPILCVLAFITIIAVVVYKRNEICDCIRRAGQRINTNPAHYDAANQDVALGNQNGEGGHAEGNPEQVALNVDNQQD